MTLLVRGWEDIGYLRITDLKIMTNLVYVDSRDEMRVIYSTDRSPEMDRTGSRLSAKCYSAGTQPFVLARGSSVVRAKPKINMSSSKQARGTVVY